ncbi:MAG: protoporphyrinogen oxidase [Armatimonadota bacterium]|nr:protoporphyrinogen oxidase [Armatimonadota bacterium]MDR5704335.1 protoporphyrinogen oxidase [Armatimonadota bacterium]
MAMRHVVIVGGGITGLSAALEVQSLARQHHLPVRCTLIEKEARLGGKILTIRQDGFLVEAGPDSFLAIKPWATDLCHRLGLGDQLIAQEKQPVYILHRGRLHPLPEEFLMGIVGDLRSLAQSSLFSLLEKARMLFEPFIPLRLDEQDTSVGALIRRRLGQAALDRLAGPLIAGIYAGNPEELSVLAAAPYLVELMRSGPGLLLGALRMQARRKGTRSSPSFLTLAGGLQDLVDRLRASLHDVDIQIGVAARSLKRRSLGYTVELTDGTALDADAVLLTIPAFAAAELLSSLAPHVAEILWTIPYASTATISLAYRREEIQHPLSGSGFLVSREERGAVTACTWVSSKWPGRVPSGAVLLRAYVGEFGREEALNRDDERIVAIVEETLAPLLSIKGRPLFSWITRWHRAMPQYTPGHLSRVARVEEELTHFPGLHIAGAAYRGVGIPDCIHQGQLAAQKVVQELWPNVNIQLPRQADKNGEIFRHKLLQN